MHTHTLWSSTLFKPSVSCSMPPMKPGLTAGTPASRRDRQVTWYDKLAPVGTHESRRANRGELFRARASSIDKRRLVPSPAKATQRHVKGFRLARAWGSRRLARRTRRPLCRHVRSLCTKSALLQFILCVCNLAWLLIVNCRIVFFVQRHWPSLLSFSLLARWRNGQSAVLWFPRRHLAVLKVYCYWFFPWVNVL